MTRCHPPLPLPLAAILFLLAVLPSSAAAAERHEGFTKHYATSLFQTTAAKRFSIEIPVKGHGFVPGTNTLDIIIHDAADRDVTDATITVEARMPAMGHTSRPAAVIQRGGGLYTAVGLDLPMAGQWELGVTVAADTVRDTATFPLAVGQGMGHGHGMHAMPGQADGKTRAGDLDPRTSKPSAAGRFTVGYEPLAPLQVNRLHSWRLRITDSQGRPVTGAMITVRGSMPAHGHGMPTAPETVATDEPGTYLVEGMKFSMPGRWRVTVGIAAGDVRDEAIFDLLVR